MLPLSGENSPSAELAASHFFLTFYANIRVSDCVTNTLQTHPGLASELGVVRAASSSVESTQPCLSCLVETHRVVQGRATHAAPLCESARG